MASLLYRANQKENSKIGSARLSRFKTDAAEKQPLTLPNKKTQAVRLSCCTRNSRNSRSHTCLTHFSFRGSQISSSSSSPSNSSSRSCWRALANLP